MVELFMHNKKNKLINFSQVSKNTFVQFHIKVSNRKLEKTRTFERFWFGSKRKHFKCCTAAYITQIGTFATISPLITPLNGNF